MTHCYIWLLIAYYYYPFLTLLYYTCIAIIYLFLENFPIIMLHKIQTMLYKIQREISNYFSILCINTLIEKPSYLQENSKRGVIHVVIPESHYMKIMLPHSDNK
jgi:hypothetical protein